jgi:hypothetical protein
MKRLLYIIITALSVACSNEEPDRRVIAYDNAVLKVMEAKDQEQLLEISYKLHYELATLEKELGSIDSLATVGSRSNRKRLEAIEAARDRYDEVLKKREMEFYISNNGKKK